DKHTMTFADEGRTTHPPHHGMAKLRYDHPTNKLTYTAEDGTPTEIPLNETGLEYEAEDGILTYTNSLGVEQPIDLSGIVSEQERSEERRVGQDRHTMT